MLHGRRRRRHIRPVLADDGRRTLRRGAGILHGIHERVDIQRRRLRRLLLEPGQKRSENAPDQVLSSIGTSSCTKGRGARASPFSFVSHSIQVARTTAHRKEHVQSTPRLVRKPEFLTEALQDFQNPLLEPPQHLFEPDLSIAEYRGEQGHALPECDHGDTHDGCGFAVR